ncbi:hypothetical protein GYMLUDRAFT_642792 [Collybiopsis luxurians FD-317 M1]|nr:hypothetical protein GYMLUDRAFT_642792 [Collybiopsis luxurians FD-317 M1]
MRNHLSTDRACVDDVYPLLEIFQSCWPPSSQALRQHAYLFLDEFQGWIERTTQTGLLRTRISEIVCSLTRSIHYMVHYFATDLITSSRFVEFAKFVDGRAILLGIDTRSLRTGRSTWQEAKRILVTRSSLPPDFFPMSPKFPAEIWNPAASSSRLPDSSYHGSSVNDLPRSTEDDRRSTFSLPPDSRSCSVEEL